MSHKESFTEYELYDKASYLTYLSTGETNTVEKFKMKKILKKAIAEELSGMQKHCLVEHYIRGKKMKDIATELNLNPSTVTRHIKRATEKLRRIASYY